MLIVRDYSFLPSLSSCWRSYCRVSFRFALDMMSTWLVCALLARRNYFPLNLGSSNGEGILRIAFDTEGEAKKGGDEDDGKKSLKSTPQLIFTRKLHSGEPNVTSLWTKRTSPPNATRGVCPSGSSRISLYPLASTNSLIPS